MRSNPFSHNAISLSSCVEEKTESEARVERSPLGWETPSGLRKANTSVL